MRFVAIRNAEQQTLSAIHRWRDALVSQRNVAINQVHGLLLEFGITLAATKTAIQCLPRVIEDSALPLRLRAVLLRLHAHIQSLTQEIQAIETELVAQANAGDATQFRSGRDFAASLGLVPRQYSTGGRANLLGISKRGNKHVRRLLVQGARAVMQHAERRTDALGLWLRQLLQRRRRGYRLRSVSVGLTMGLRAL